MNQKDCGMEPERELEAGAGTVINYIVQGVLQKRFHTGDKLPTEVELCELTGASRNNVREAMKTLNANRIVNIRRGSGTYLSASQDISIKLPLIFKVLLHEACFEDIYVFRESLEICVLRLAICNGTQEDLEALDQINERLYQVSQLEGDHQNELGELECQFHMTLARATHNKLLYDVYEMLFDVFRVMILRNFSSGQSGIIAYNTHLSITKAVRNRDLIEAICAAKESVISFGDWVNHASAAELLSSELLTKEPTKK